MSKFWSTLPKPFFALAPMADVTDAAFRRIITKYGKPDVLWTEFVAVDGLLSPGRDILMRDLLYVPAERPIVAQIFGGNPEHFEKVAAFIATLGFDGIDINMGCPDRNVEKQGGGASLIKDPARAIDIILATKSGAPHLPVSVKTRVGYNTLELDTWIPKLLSTTPAALTIHARTRKEMSDVPAVWSHVRTVVEMAQGTGIRIIGNGDVVSLADGRAKALETGCDGIMIGRGIFGNPFLFSGRDLSSLPLPERFAIMIEHTKLFMELLGDVKNFAVMKKHYKAYVNGFDGAKELRIALMDAESVAEVEEHVKKFLGETNL
jgi:nifR3 family TIM-barrel protein